MQHTPHKRKNSKNIRKKRMFNRILTVLLLLFLLIFVFSSTMAGKEWLQGKREQETFEKLSSTIIDEENKTTDVLHGQDEEYTAYTDLYEKNNDFAAGLQYRIRI